MIKTVFLDMDGVLANFRKGVHDAFNKPYDYTTLSPKWKFWDDWPDVTFEMVNAVCNTSFWWNLEWMHDGCDILRAIEYKFAPAQIYLLTTPMPNLKSADGKMMWVRDQIPAYLNRTIITQAPKHLLARPDTLLIDDKDKNIDGFVKAGEHGILIPRPWNELHGWTNETLQVVKNSLEELC